MEMKYVKPLVDENVITSYEEVSGFMFPVSYKEFIAKFNGGRPSLKCFKTKAGSEKVIKSFLSFNRKDRESIWNVTEWNEAELQNQYIPFAIEPAGNLICMDKKDKSIVFIELETLRTESVSPDFKSFISELF